MSRLFGQQLSVFSTCPSHPKVQVKAGPEGWNFSQIELESLRGASLERQVAVQSIINLLAREVVVKFSWRVH
jgi:hypothetical protein